QSAARSTARHARFRAGPSPARVSRTETGAETHRASHPQRDSRTATGPVHDCPQTPECPLESQGPCEPHWLWSALSELRGDALSIHETRVVYPGVTEIRQ